MFEDIPEPGEEPGDHPPAGQSNGLGALTPAGAQVAGKSGTAAGRGSPYGRRINADPARAGSRSCGDVFSSRLSKCSAPPDRSNTAPVLNEHASEQSHR